MLFMGPLLPSRSRIVVVGQLYEQHSRTRVILYTKLQYRNEQHDRTSIKNAQLKNLELVEAALANKNHKLHEAAHRVAAQDKAEGFNALPFSSES